MEEKLSWDKLIQMVL